MKIFKKEVKRLSNKSKESYLIKKLQSDLKYSHDECIRLLDESLNLEEIIKDLNEQIKVLEDKLDEIEDEY